MSSESLSLAGGRCLASHACAPRSSSGLSSPVPAWTEAFRLYRPADLEAPCCLSLQSGLYASLGLTEAEPDMSRVETALRAFSVHGRLSALLQNKVSLPHPQCLGTRRSSLTCRGSVSSQAVTGRGGSLPPPYLAAWLTERARQKVRSWCWGNFEGIRRKQTTPTALRTGVEERHCCYFSHPLTPPIVMTVRLTSDMSV